MFQTEVVLAHHPGCYGQVHSIQVVFATDAVNERRG
jgi:hypothetical protein